MSKPHPFAVAALARLSGIVQGVTAVARFVAAEDEPPPGPRPVLPADAPRRVTDGRASVPSAPTAPAAPARAACPRVRMPGWRCPLPDAHAGPCVLEETAHP